MLSNDNMSTGLGDGESFIVRERELCINASLELLSLDR